MAKRRKRTHGKGVAAAVIVLIAVITALLLHKDAFFGGLTDKPSAPTDGELVQFHFIDVGQGDAALIRTPKGDILIDAGTNSSEDQLKAYLDQLGVTELEYAVFTHPHEDHIGGADMILNTYTVKRVILPDKEHDSKTFERMMDAIEAEKCEVIMATPDKTFKVGDLTCTILAPIGTAYTELNNYSVVIRADYGETSVLFTGDAETHSEEEMLERYRFKGILDCDILKAGHHGSDTSSSQAFLDAVTPVHAVISVGEGNTYDHPKQEILARYEAMRITIHRTDKEGSIVFTTTGGEPVKK
jgi:competence protein ComEC